MAETDKFEKATLMSFYYVIKEGAPYAPLDEDTYKKIKARPTQYSVPKVTRKTKTQSEFTVEQELSQKMAKSMLTEYPNMDYNKWYLGILRGSAALNKHLGYKEGHKDSCWLYGHFGSGAGLSPVGEIPNGEDTSIMDFTWNSFSQEMKDVFDRKKDSWNTADVYMVKKNDVSEIEKGIKKALCIGHRHDSELEKIGWCLGISEVNTYMSELIQQKKLLPLSLKQATPNAVVKITPNNLKKDPDGVEGLTGEIEGALSDKLKVIRVDGEPRFKGNSLRFTCKFEQGNIGFRYIYESKVSSNEAHATEPRDKVWDTQKEKYVQASARNGAIPAPKMAELVQKFTKASDINENIPMNKKLSKPQIDYWIKKIEFLSKGFNGIKVNIGTPEIDGQTKTISEFIKEAAIIDGAQPHARKAKTKYEDAKLANFDCLFRSKLRSFRYIDMIYEASNQNPSQLGELLAMIYFYSAKINFKKGQLSGPFIKVQ